MADRLYRSRDDRMLAGVAGGIAQMYDQDPSLVRIAWAVIALLSGGIAIVVYIVMAIVVPNAPTGYVWPDAGVDAPGDPAATTVGAVPGMAGIVGADDGRRSPRQRRREGRSPSALLIGLILIAVGAFFLIRELLPAIDLSLWWPAASLVFGVLLVIASIRPTRTPS